MANFKIVIYACAFLFAVGCAHHGDVQNAPDLSERNVVLGQVLQPALIAFSALKEKGALPGLGADEHGSLDAFPSDGKGTNSSYPQSVTIRVEKENAVEWFYFYTLQKSSKQSDWLLAKAWKQEKLSGKKINLKNDKILPP